MQQLLYAHRGASGQAPENTLRSFKLAFDQGADGIECDVNLTRDHELVVFHDPILDRTTNSTGWVKDVTLQEIKKLDAGDGEQVPTLLEVVDLAQKHNKKLIIEFKNDPLASATATAHALTGFLIDNNITRDVIVYSYWVHAAKMTQGVLPDGVKVGIVTYIGVRPQDLIELVNHSQASVLSTDWLFLDKSLVHAARDHEITLCSYVLNDDTSFDYAKNLGVEILLTDYPGRFTL